MDSLNRKLFGSPQPKLIKEGKPKSKNQICVRDGKVHKGQTSITRPSIPDHVCIKESNCDICRFFINSIDRKRGFINGK